jgi:hypothetical protein
MERLQCLIRVDRRWWNGRDDHVGDYRSKLIKGGPPRSDLRASLWFGPVEGGYACLGSAHCSESLCQDVSPTVHIKEADDTATPERIDIIISSLSILIQPSFAVHASKSQIGTQ